MDLQVPIEPGTLQTLAVTPTQLAIALAVFLAGLFVGAVLAQAFGGRKQRQDVMASELFRDYERRCFDNPVFANPNLARFDYVNLTVDNDSKTFERYQWFVSLMLNAARTILALRPTRDWRNLMRAQFKQHHAYLRSTYFAQTGYLDRHFDRNFRALVKQALREVDREEREREKKLARGAYA
jgi:hypothetical protein